MNIRSYIVHGISTFTLLVVLVFGFALFRRQSHMEQTIHSLINNDMATMIDAQGAQVVEKVVSNARLWRPIQEKVRDTVVQIFSQVAVTDMLQPYRTPAQGTSSGTGFFINDKGDLITNAHVVVQAKGIWLQIPSMGKKVIDAYVVGMSPERDIALLRVSEEGLETIRNELGSIPYLPLGDSDLIRRSDEVLALGYPLAQQSLKSTTGVVSGREQDMIQMSAPINPGSSGGPLVNVKGEVVGINSAGITEAQNVGYAIPINNLKIILSDLYNVKLLHKPFLGVLFNNSTDALVDYLGNPHPGGCHVVEIIKDSTLDKAGVKKGDMIYEINGHKVDSFGEMSVPWSEDKISIINYVGRLSIGEKIDLVVYRNGERKKFNVAFTQRELPKVRQIYPDFDKVDYEVFAGMVVQELCLNHVQMLRNQAPGLAKYAMARNQEDKVLVITHLFPTSHAYRSRSLGVGAAIKKINGMDVHTLEQYRQALRKNDGKYFTMVVEDNITRIADEIFIALEWPKIIEQEVKLSQDFRYPMTDTAKELLRAAHAQDALKKEKQA